MRSQRKRVVDLELKVFEFIGAVHGKVEPGQALRSEDRLGGARQAWYGAARLCGALLGEARQARPGNAGLGMVG